MTVADAAVRAFAEDPEAHVALGPDQERILTDRYCVTFSPGAHFWSTSVRRVRFGDGERDVESAVHEIRELMAERGRRAAAWAIGPSATPTGLVRRLLGLGFEAESEEGSVILVLNRPPTVRSSPFRVKTVTTLDDHLASIEVGSGGFTFSDDDALDERQRARETFEAERTGGHSARLLALDGDRPVATGRAWFSPLGLYLGGGATLPSDRQRGAMSALVGTAWEEAVARGTPVLVTHGGVMAAPALERLGFRPVGRVRHLIDRFP